MLGIDRRSVQNFDWMLFGLTVILATAGIVNLIAPDERLMVSAFAEGPDAELFLLDLDRGAVWEVVPPAEE